MVKRFGTEALSLFYPAPDGLPIPVFPPEGKLKMRHAILDLNLEDGRTRRDPLGVRAGALWVHGFIEDAHKTAQDDPSAEGSYWHALVHRSDGDFENSLYWFTRVRVHPIFSELQRRAEKIVRSLDVKPVEEMMRALHARGPWDPGLFVRICRDVRDGKEIPISLLQRIAAEEYNLLMQYCLAEK